MALTTRQGMLLHLIVRRFDREANATYLDPVILEDELAASLPELAGDIDVLEAEGYVERGHIATAAEDEVAAFRGEDPWVLIPTDSGILAAMGLG